MLLSLFSLSSFASLHVPERLGTLVLFNSPQGFAVSKDKKVHLIESDALDATLRQMDYKQRSMYMMKGALTLNQADNGQYTLQSRANLKGGGALGAAIGCWLGKAVVYLGAYGTIAIVSLVTGPAAPVTFSALTAAWALPIEAASQAGAVAGGIVGGVATGPV